MKPLIVFGLLVCVFTAYASSALDSNNTIHNFNRNQLEEGFVHKLNTKCTQRDNHSCMMLKLIVYMNRMFKKSSIEITQNLKVTQTRALEEIQDSDDELLLARSTKAEDEILGIILSEKLWKFIRTRSLRYQLLDNTYAVVTTEPKGNLNVGLSISPGTVVEEGRGRMKHLAPLFAAVATKIGVIGALVFKGLALLVGKALIVSKIALVLAVIIALKKLLHKKHVTYEVVAHPPHSHEPPPSSHHPPDSYSTGWGRALEGFVEGLAEVPQQMLDAHDLAFAQQKP